MCMPKVLANACGFGCPTVGLSCPVRDEELAIGSRVSIRAIMPLRLG